jgi:hypothetical protein
MQPKEIFKMKNRLFTLLCILIALSLLVVVPVSAKDREGKAFRSGAVVYNGQPHNIFDVRASAMYPCIMGRTFVSTEFGKPRGMYGCHYPWTLRFYPKVRW